MAKAEYKLEEQVKRHMRENLMKTHALTVEMRSRMRDQLNAIEEQIVALEIAIKALDI